MEGHHFYELLKLAKWTILKDEESVRGGTTIVTWGGGHRVGEMGVGSLAVG